MNLSIRQGFGELVFHGLLQMCSVGAEVLQRVFW